MILACFLLASLLFLRPPAVRGLEVTILDTGQGDGICIRAKDRVILVDGGSTDQKELGKYRLEPFFKAGESVRLTWPLSPMGTGIISAV